MTAASDLGIIGDGVTDCAPAFRTALAPGVRIEFGPGVYMFGSQVDLPSGADIRGCGIGTQFSPLASFGPRLPLSNALLSTVPYSTGVRVSDLFLDGLAIGTETTASRICGLVMRRTTGFIVRHVVSGQWSGYAHWASGDGGLPEEKICSGIYEDCIAYDSNALFEQSRCDGVELWRCKGHDGRRRIMIEGAFHQLSGASNVLHHGCSFVGRAGGGILSAATNGEDLTGLVFRHHRIEMQSNSAALLGGPNPPNPAARIGMVIEDSFFSASLANGASLTGVNLTSRRNTFRGMHVGLGTGDNSTVLLEDTEIATNNYPHPTAWTQALYLGGNSVTTVTRGALRTRGVNARPHAKEPNATLNLSPQTIIETIQQPA